MNFGLIEHLIHSTVRIETEVHDSGGIVGIGTGTGFIINFLSNRGFGHPVIITNKHVVANASIGRFHLNFSTNEGLPYIGSHQQFQFSDFENLWIKHPNPKIDLAAFPIGALIDKVKKTGSRLFCAPLETTLIPDYDERDSYSSMEDIIMMGYPNGIWDAKNNLPVIRRGITATHSNISWNGRPEFLTDIAIFPGSSGSPVFLANMSGYTDSNGINYTGTNSVRLLGVLYAGTTHNAQGEISVMVPTVNNPFSITSIPNNIGIVINSEEILELENEFHRKLNRNAVVFPT